MGVVVLGAAVGVALGDNEAVARINVLLNVPTVTGVTNLVFVTDG